MRDFVLAFALIIFLVGCNQNSEDSNPANSSPENQSPEVHSVTATPDTLEQGNKTDLLCLATDPDGDDLDYFWSAELGSISGNGNEIEWESPAVDGKHWIHVSVSDGMAITSDSVQVTVVPNDDQQNIEVLSTTGTVGFALDID